MTFVLDMPGRKKTKVPLLSKPIREVLTLQLTARAQLRVPSSFRTERGREGLKEQTAINILRIQASIKGSFSLYDSISFTDRCHLFKSQFSIHIIKCSSDN